MGLSIKISLYFYFLFSFLKTGLYWPVGRSVGSSLHWPSGYFYLALFAVKSLPLLVDNMLEGDLSSANALVKKGDAKASKANKKSWTSFFSLSSASANEDAGELYSSAGNIYKSNKASTINVAVLLPLL